MRFEPIAPGSGFWPGCGFRYGFFFRRRVSTRALYTEILIWCSEQFDHSYGRESRWYELGGCFYFRTDADAIAFKLRWWDGD